MNEHAYIYPLTDNKAVIPLRFKPDLFPMTNTGNEIFNFKTQLNKASSIYEAMHHHHVISRQ